jgi:starch synthase
MHEMVRVEEHECPHTYTKEEKLKKNNPPSPLHPSPEGAPSLPLVTTLRYTRGIPLAHTSTQPAYSPSYDNKIFKKFSMRTIESKVENKLSFQKEMGWVMEKKMPLLCISGGMTDEQGGRHFQELLEGILSLDCQIVVRGVGSEEYGKIFTKLAADYSHRFKIVPDEDVMRRKMYASCDVALFFAPDETELLNCLSYGTVPVTPEQKHLANYDPVQEAGNAFVADPMDSWNWFAALVRAIETYKLPYDWRTIQRHAMETVKGE